MATKRTYHVIVPATGEAIEYQTTGKEYAFAAIVYFPRREEFMHRTGQVEVREAHWAIGKRSATESGAANHNWKNTHNFAVVPIIEGPAPVVEAAEETPAEMVVDSVTEIEIDPKTLVINTALVWSAAPDCGEAHDDGAPCQVVHYARPAGEHAVEVYTCHGPRVVKIADLRKVRPTERDEHHRIVIDSDLVDEAEVDEDAVAEALGEKVVPPTGPLHFTYNDLLTIAEHDAEAGCKVARLHLREDDTAPAMGTTKYEHYGPGLVTYYIRPDGVNAITDCPVRHIRRKG